MRVSLGVVCRYEDPCDPNYRYPRLDDPFGEEEAQRKRKTQSSSSLIRTPPRSL